MAIRARSGLSFSAVVRQTDVAVFYATVFVRLFIRFETVGAESWATEKSRNLRDGMKMLSSIYVVVIEKHFFSLLVFVGANIRKGASHTSTNDIDIDVQEIFQLWKVCIGQGLVCVYA